MAARVATPTARQHRSAAASAASAAPSCSPIAKVHYHVDEHDAERFSMGKQLEDDAATWGEEEGEESEGGR